MKKTLLLLALLTGCAPSPETRTVKCEFRPGDEIKVQGKFYWTELDIKRNQPKHIIPEPVRALFNTAGRGYHHEVRIMEGDHRGQLGYVHESDFR